MLDVRLPLRLLLVHGPEVGFKDRRSVSSPVDECVYVEERGRVQVYKGSIQDPAPTPYDQTDRQVIESYTGRKTGKT